MAKYLLLLTFPVLAVLSLDTNKHKIENEYTIEEGWMQDSMRIGIWVKTYKKAPIKIYSYYGYVGRDTSFTAIQKSEHFYQDTLTHTYIYRSGSLVSIDVTNENLFKKHFNYESKHVGGNLFHQRCASCHNLHDNGRISSKEWAGFSIDEIRNFNNKNTELGEFAHKGLSLSKSDIAYLFEYIQNVTYYKKDFIEKDTFGNSSKKDK